MPLKKEYRLKDSSRIGDYEPAETFRSVPSVVFAIELGDMQSDFSVRLRFLNRNFFVLSEYTREELNEPGFDFLDKLIVQSDQKIVLKMIKNLAAKGYLATDTEVFNVLTKSGESVSVICCLNVVALHHDKSLKSLSGCMIEYNDEIWTPEQHVICLKKRIPPEICEIIQTITKTELRVLKLIARGYTDSSIAAILGIKKSTVIFHRRNLEEKTGCPNAAALVAWAVRFFLTDNW
jgi:DNA-binding CsgD family transcriptional regulator